MIESYGLRLDCPFHHWSEQARISTKTEVEVKAHVFCILAGGLNCTPLFQAGHSLALYTLIWLNSYFFLHVYIIVTLTVIGHRLSNLIDYSPIYWMNFVDLSYRIQLNGIVLNWILMCHQVQLWVLVRANNSRFLSEELVSIVVLFEQIFQ